MLFRWMALESVLNAVQWLLPWYNPPPLALHVRLAICLIRWGNVHMMSLLGRGEGLRNSRLKEQNQLICDSDKEMGPKILDL